MLDRVPRWAWGLSGRLTASYILVTLAVVVLVEALVLGFQVPSLVNGAQLQVHAGCAASTGRSAVRADHHDCKRVLRLLPALLPWL